MHNYHLAASSCRACPRVASPEQLSYRETGLEFNKLVAGRADECLPLTRPWIVSLEGGIRVSHLKLWQEHRGQLEAAQSSQLLD